MKKIALIGFLGVTALLVGCPDSGSSTDDICVRYYESLRSFSNRCLGYDETEGTVDRFKVACQRVLDAPGASNAKSYVQTCADALATGGCESALSVCEASTVTGDFDDGTACGESVQCKSAYCKKENGNECGKCTARLPIGADCKDGGRCAIGSDCAYELSGTTSTQRCVAEKKLGVGEDCTAKPSESVRCSDGLRCKREGTGPEAKSKCATREPEGGACTSIVDCVYGLACNAGKCGPRPAIGADCGPGEECVLGALCNPTSKKCDKVLIVNAGEACDDLHRCKSGSCEGESTETKEDGTTFVKQGKCVAPLADGASCKKGELPTDGPAPRCDAYADCVNGICAFSDPAACK